MPLQAARLSQHNTLNLVCGYTLHELLLISTLRGLVFPAMLAATSLQGLLLLAAFLCCMATLQCHSCILDHLDCSFFLMQIRLAMERAILATHAHALPADGTADLSAAASKRFLPPAVHARVGSCVLALLSLLLITCHNVFKLFDMVGGCGGALVAARRLDGRVIQSLLKGDSEGAGLSDPLASERPEAAAAAQLRAAAAGDKEAVRAADSTVLVSMLATNCVHESCHQALRRDIGVRHEAGTVAGALQRCSKHTRTTWKAIAIASCTTSFSFDHRSLWEHRQDSF